MKKILVRYTMEVPVEKFDKACKIAMMVTNPMIAKLRQMAEINGRVSVHKFINKIIGD